MSLDDLVEGLKNVYGGSLRTVALYGSAAAGETAPGHSDINVLVIVDSIPLSRLRAEGEAIREWVKAGNRPPFTLTSAEWRASADIFPMEYSDILERHRVLHGELPPGGMVVRDEDLRLELEREAVGKLIHLRLGLLHAGGSPELEGGLMLAAFSTFTAICRGLLRLYRRSVSPDDEEVLRSASRIAGFDPTSVLRVLEHRRGKRLLERHEVAGIMDGYVAAAERIAQFVDQLWRDAEGRSRVLEEPGG